MIVSRVLAVPLMESIRTKGFIFSLIRSMYDAKQDTALDIAEIIINTAVTAPAPRIDEILSRFAQSSIAITAMRIMPEGITIIVSILNRPTGVRSVYAAVLNIGVISSPIAPQMNAALFLPIADDAQMSRRMPNASEKTDFKTRFADE